ncbi:MAG TPA: cytochrome c oxidase subunit II [Candidatus Kapabacteria bacterium]|jgi:cytochrome c oxidase subunit 2|nr:cytochrome c oxidase subunit II [Candidatus Kapabacteria bacterium]
MLSTLASSMMLGMSELIPEQASTYAPDVDHLYYFLVGTTIFFTVLISGAILYFFIKYRRRSNNEIPQPIAGSMVLESAWSIIPFIISLGMFAWGAKIYLDQYTIPKDATDIYVVGKQWMWKFQHPEGQREINELHVPVGKKIRLVMASEDVIHSFFVPAFRMKEDVVPGPNRYSTVWFEATQTGTFHIFCSQYCGTSHSAMIGWVTVMDDKDYQSWLAGGAAQGSMADQGAALFQQFGCASCHRSDAQGQCPRLDGIYGKEQLLEGGEKVVADDSYIRESVLSPLAKVVAGFKPVMPSFQGQVSEEQLQQLIAYIKSIGPPEANNVTPGAPQGSTKISGAASNPVSRPPIMTTGSPNVGAPQNERAMPEVLPPANPAAPNQPGQTR